MKNDSDWIMFFEQSLGPTVWFSETPLIGSPMGKKKNYWYYRDSVVKNTSHRLRTSWIILFYLINSRNVLDIAYSNR